MKLSFSRHKGDMNGLQWDLAAPLDSAGQTGVMA